MSVLTKKQPTNSSGKFRANAAMIVPKAQLAAQQAQVAAQQAALQAQATAQAAAQQAAPLAKNAREGAIAWATPKVDSARSWAAPQLEQTARIVSESLAPMIASALTNAARKVDAPQRKKPRRRGAMFTGIALLVAAAGAGAVVAMRLRAPTVEITSVEATNNQPPDPDMNGHSEIV